MPVLPSVHREPTQATTWLHGDRPPTTLPIAPATELPATLGIQLTPTPTLVSVVTGTVISRPSTSSVHKRSLEAEGGAIVASLVGFTILVLLVLCYRTRRSGNNRNNRQGPSPPSSPKRPSSFHPGPSTAPNPQFPSQVYQGAKSDRRPSRYISVRDGADFLVVKKARPASRPGMWVLPTGSFGRVGNRSK